MSATAGTLADNASAITTTQSGDLLFVERSGVAHKMAVSDRDAESPYTVKHIKTEAISSNTVVDFTSADIDVSTYKDFIFVLRNVEPATDGADLTLLTSSDGGSTFRTGATDYDVLSRVHSLSTDTPVGGFEANVGLFGSVGNAANQDGISGEITLFNAGSSLATILKSDVSGRTSAGTFFNVRQSIEAGSVATNGVRFVFSTGNLASGEISLYGRRG